MSATGFYGVFYGLALLWSLLGCGTSQQSATGPVLPEPIDLAECGLCGMVVGEQPPPRAQLAYRDGAHLHFCSIEEARAQAAAPGPRGTPLGAWVEALPADYDWASTDPAPHDWIAADEAHFVFGAERRMVMGVPVLSYGEADVAARVASSLNTRPVSWRVLLDTPVPEIPPQSRPSLP